MIYNIYGRVLESTQDYSDITPCKNLNPSFCASQVLPPTSIPIANVWPSPGTSTIPHRTPSALSTRHSSRLTSTDTIASSAP